MSMSHGGRVSADISEGLQRAYRTAALAYRGMRQQGHMDLEAHRGATEAVVGVRPDLTAAEAGRIAGAAVVYASTHHSEWFWRGVGSSRQED
jgi:hypothetical protein